MRDIVASLKVLRNKVNVKEDHKHLDMHDVGTCDDAAKEIQDLRYRVALLDDENRKLCREARDAGI